MEQNLFRPRCRGYEGEAKNIHIAELLDPRGELCFVAREITRLVREDGYCYKDIAVVTGDVRSMPIMCEFSRSMQFPILSIRREILCFIRLSS